MALWLRLRVPSAEGLDSIPGWGTRSHTLQLRVHMPQLKKKNPNAANKIFFTSQSNLHFKLKGNGDRLGYWNLLGAAFYNTQIALLSVPPLETPGLTWLWDSKCPKSGLGSQPGWPRIRAEGLTQRMGSESTERMNRTEPSLCHSSEGDFFFCLV